MTLSQGPRSTALGDAPALKQLQQRNADGRLRAAPASPAHLDTKCTALAPPEEETGAGAAQHKADEDQDGDAAALAHAAHYVTVLQQAAAAEGAGLRVSGGGQRCKGGARVSDKRPFPGSSCLRLSGQQCSLPSTQCSCAQLGSAVGCRFGAAHLQQRGGARHAPTACLSPRRAAAGRAAKSAGAGGEANGELGSREAARCCYNSPGFREWIDGDPAAGREKRQLRRRAGTVPVPGFTVPVALVELRFNQQLPPPAGYTRASQPKWITSTRAQGFGEWLN